MTHKGYKQTPEHVAKRKMFGAHNPRWSGVRPTVKAGRRRAYRLYSNKPCVKCGAEKAERHHKDENTSNNRPNNIQFLCRSCHRKVHSRGRPPPCTAKGVGAAAHEKRSRKRCKRGHLLSGVNLYKAKNGSGYRRVCKTCVRMRKREWRRKHA